MTAAALLADLRGRGFTVESADNKLMVRPSSLLSEDDRQRIRKALPGLLVALHDQPTGKTGGESRPYRLAPPDADVAHAEPWDDAAIARFQARAQRIRRRGFGEQDADDLAERLHLRDVHADQRVMCLECRSLSGTLATGWRCGNHKAAAVMRDLPADLVTQMQVCPGFVEVDQR